MFFNFFVDIFLKRDYFEILLLNEFLLDGIFLDFWKEEFFLYNFTYFFAPNFDQGMGY